MRERSSRLIHVPASIFQEHKLKKNIRKKYAEEGYGLYQERENGRMRVSDSQISGKGL